MVRRISPSSFRVQGMMAGADDGSVQLDVSHAESQVWLLKVYPNVDKAWQSSRPSPDASLAKIICSFDPLNPDPNSALEFTMELTGTDLKPADSAAAPDIKVYSLNLQKDVVPTHIFSESQGKMAVEGKLERKFDMKPNSRVQSEYRQLCRDRDRKSNTKTRTIQVISDDRGSLMRPIVSSTISTTPFMKDLKRKVPVPPKGNEGKRTRRERGELEEIVFKLFERQQNWALKQLVTETDQPVAFLKEILNDLCIYNKRGTNQGTYELKPEYKKNPVAEEEKPAAT